jgi:hypothetical protein
MNKKEDWWKIAGEIQRIYNMLEVKRDFTDEEYIKIKEKLRDLMNKLEAGWAHEQ